jgi:hypothetical protein
LAVLIRLLSLRFLGVARLRLRPQPPCNLPIRFCVDSVTCFEMMSEVRTSGALSAISDKILLPVRNASRPNALTVALPKFLPRTKEEVLPIEKDRPKNYLYRDLSVNTGDLCRPVQYHLGHV